MKRFTLWSLTILVLLAALVLPWLMIDPTAKVEAPPAFSRRDIVWAQALFNQYDPRRGPSNVTQSLSLSTDELNRLLNYAVALKPISGMEAELNPQNAIIGASLKLPPTPFGSYLNVQVELLSHAGQAEVSRMQIGSVPLPGIFGRWAGHLAHRLLTRDPAYAAISESVRGIEFDENRVTLDYVWQPKLLTQLQRKSAALLIPDEDRARLLVYAKLIQQQLKPLPQGAKIPLYRLIQPVFALAGSQGDDPVSENRAAITALAAYVSGVSLTKLLKEEGRNIRREPPVILRLHGRWDFSQHYLIAAALAANGGSQLANALGLAKEEDDAKRGSGFSFTDLAADRAAARLGERLTDARATQTQHFLAQASQDIDLMPDFTDLPEFMPGEEFVRRFGGVGSSRYESVIHEIDKRLTLHPLLGQKMVTN